MVLSGQRFCQPVFPVPRLPGRNTRGAGAVGHGLGRRFREATSQGIYRLYSMVTPVHFRSARFAAGPVERTGHRRVGHCHAGDLALPRGPHGRPARLSVGAPAGVGCRLAIGAGDCRLLRRCARLLCRHWCRTMSALASSLPNLLPRSRCRPPWRFYDGPRHHRAQASCSLSSCRAMQPATSARCAGRRRLDLAGVGCRLGR